MTHYILPNAISLLFGLIGMMGQYYKKGWWFWFWGFVSLISIVFILLTLIGV